MPLSFTPQYAAANLSGCAGHGHGKNAPKLSWLRRHHGGMPTARQHTQRLICRDSASRLTQVRRSQAVSVVTVQAPPGRDASAGRSYFATAMFSNPEGNSWVLQEVTSRLPGREWRD